jgi:hypothetical protein
MGFFIFMEDDTAESNFKTMHFKKASIFMVDDKVEFNFKIKHFKAFFVVFCCNFRFIIIFSMVFILQFILIQLSFVNFISFMY